MPDPLRVTVHPLSPYAGLEPYEDSPPSGSPYDGFEPYSEPEPKKPLRAISGGESAGRGALTSATFGLEPALVGVAAAGGDQPTTIAGRASGEAAKRPVVGAIKLLAEQLGLSQKDLTSLITDDTGPATRAYRKARNAEREENEQAFEQNPKSYIGGALAGGLATTPVSPFGAATTLGRIGEGVAVGAGAGALSGAGESISRGEDLGDIVKNSAFGGVVGGGGGGVASSAVEGVGSAARRLATGARTLYRPEDEAARQVGEAIAADRLRGPPPSPADEAAARATGLPLSTLDRGGQATRDLARTVANRSPAAWDAIQEFTRDRFRGQSGRISQFVNNMFGGLDNPATSEGLRNAYRATTTPLYQRAYAAGDRPIISPELEQLLGSPSVGRAMASAVRNGQDRATVQGLGAFRPYVNVTPDGRVQFPPGPRGVPAYPNLQLWDYTQRELSDMIGQAQRSGRNSEASALTQINNRLKSELDRQVPEFRAARRSAAEYFGANNALEAGQQFVSGNQDLNEAGRVIARMNPAERELFARGFAGEFIRQVGDTRDTANVLNRIGQSDTARRKLMMAMGPQRAQQVDTVLTVEALADRAREALGNSTTAKQLSNLVAAGGHAGAGAGVGAGGVALYEYLNEGGFDPVHVLLGGAALGGLRLHLGHADQEVARRIGEMLVSQDPAVIDRAYQMIGGHPRIFREIRRLALGGSSAVSRIAGPTATAAAGASALEWLHQRGADHHQNNHLDNLLDQQQQ